MFPQSACHCRCIITLVAFVRFVSTKASKHLLVQMLHFGFAFEFAWNLHDSNLLSATNLLYSIKKISILVYSVKVRGIKQTLSKGQQQSQKNPVSASAMLTGKFLRIRKVFARRSLLAEEFPDIWKMSGYYTKYPDNMQSRDELEIFHMM